MGLASDEIRLNQAQKDVLWALRFTNSKDRLSQTELQEMTGYSQPGVSSAVKVLREAGLVESFVPQGQRHSYVWLAPRVPLVKVRKLCSRG